MFEDLDQFSSKSGKASSCKINSFLDSVDESDRKILQDALDDHLKWSTHGLHHALTQKGVDIGYQTIYRHRKGTCVCRRKNV